MSSHPPRGGCWLKYLGHLSCAMRLLSPSARRVLVEMSTWSARPLHRRSPSARRVLVEMVMTRSASWRPQRHPPRGGCWLKFVAHCLSFPTADSHPPRGGCWLKSLDARHPPFAGSHPPRGGCWLKYRHALWPGRRPGVTLREEGVG